MAAAVGMKAEHRKILRRSRNKLVKDLEPAKLIYFMSSIISEEDEEEIRACKSRNEQAETLLDMLPKRGEKAFEVFVYALKNKQPHLAEVLLSDSGTSLTSLEEADQSMAVKYRDILRNSREMLKGMDLNKILPLMGVFMDSVDKEKLSAKDTRLERFDEFMALLPRKGPQAFEHFVRVLESIHPQYAIMLMKEAGMDPSVTDPLDNFVPQTNKVPTPKQEISNPLDQLVMNVDPAKLSRFFEQMNKEDPIQGPGWRRLLEVFQLPPSSEGAIKSIGNPTSAILQNWCSKEARRANVAALLYAVHQTGRGDCLIVLEDDLGFKLECTDAPVQNLADKTSAMHISPDAKEAGNVPKPRPTNLRDLDRQTIEKLARILDGDGQMSSHIKQQLKGNFAANEPILHILLDPNNKIMGIRELTSIIRGCQGGAETIAEMKKVLPTGVTGPVLPEKMKSSDMPYRKRAVLTRKLTVDDNWKTLACYFGMENDKIKYLDQRESKNPADGALGHWEMTKVGTVGELYDILIELDMPLIADLL